MGLGQDNLTHDREDSGKRSSQPEMGMVVTRPGQPHTELAGTLPHPLLHSQRARLCLVLEIRR